MRIPLLARYCVLLLIVMVGTDSTADAKLYRAAITIDEAEAVINGLERKIALIKEISLASADQEIKQKVKSNPKGEFETDAQFKKRKQTASSQKRTIKKNWIGWYRQQVNPLRKQIVLIKKKDSYASNSLPFQLKDYDPDNQAYPLSIQLEEGSKLDVRFDIPLNDARKIKQEKDNAEVFAGYFFHKTLGKTIFVAMLIGPDGKRYTTPVLDWKTVVGHLSMPAIYGYCPVAPSIEELSDRSVDWVPTERLIKIFNAEANRRLDGLRFQKSNVYLPLLHKGTIDFDVTVNFDKGMLEQYGIGRQLLDEKCSTCSNFTANFSSSAYKHGDSSERKYKKNPVAQQNYVFVMAHPRRSGKQDKPDSIQEDPDQEPVFLLYDGQSPRKQQLIPPTCNPQELQAGLNPLRTITNRVAKNSVAWGKLPKALSDMEKRLVRFSEYKTLGLNDTKKIRNTYASIASGLPLAPGKNICALADTSRVSKALKKLKNAQIVVEYCPDCQEDDTRLLQYRKGGIAQAWAQHGIQPKDTSVALNKRSFIAAGGKTVDLANIYYGNKGTQLKNIASEIGCAPVLRESSIATAQVSYLWNQVDRKNVRNKSQKNVAAANKAKQNAQKQLNRAQFSLAVDIIDHERRYSGGLTPKAKKVLDSTYKKIVSLLHLGNLDGASAARAYLKPRSYTQALETQWQNNPKSLDGVGVIVEGTIVQNVYDQGEFEGGDLLEVGRKKILIQTRNAALQDIYPIGTKLVVYGKFKGQFQYGPGKNVAIIRAGWVDIK